MKRPTRGKLADDVSIDFLPRRLSLAKRDLYIQIARETFPFIFPAEILFFTRFHASGTFAGNAAFRAITTFLRYYNFSVAHVKRGGFTDIIS